MDDIRFADQLFVLACGRPDVVELALDRSGDLSPGPGCAAADSVCECIIDAAVDRADGIEKLGLDRNFRLRVSVTDGVEAKADGFGEGAGALVSFDEFFVVHKLSVTCILSK